LAKGYYVSTVGLNEETIKKYIEDQEKYDIELEKLSVRKYTDPFKGRKSSKDNKGLNLYESQLL
jgi:putative transposase